MGDRSGTGDAGAAGATVQHSLFGRGEQLTQLGRLRFPDGLRARDGTVVRANILMGVMRAIDDHDRGGRGGLGCTASVQSLAECANVGRRTCFRAINVLTNVLGLVTHRRLHRDGQWIVDRRICWAAVRAFNEGEAEVDLGGESAGQTEGVSAVDGTHDQGGVSAVPTGVSAVPTIVSAVDGTGVSAVDGTLIANLNRNESPPPIAPDEWGAVAELLRSKGIRQAPAIVGRAKAAGAEPDDIRAGIAYFDEHGERNGWKVGALGWWISNWQPFAAIEDNWPARKPGRDTLDVSGVVAELERMPDAELEPLARRLLVGANYAGVRQIAFEWGYLRSGDVLACVAREMVRRGSDAEVAR